jgi:hypothetical protein
MKRSRMKEKEEEVADNKKSKGLLEHGDLPSLEIKKAGVQVPQPSLPFREEHGEMFG